MIAGVSDSSLQKLRSLYELREKRALEAIAVQRVEVDRVLEKLAEQVALIKKLRDELNDLHLMRSSTNINEMTAESMQAESNRRRWLVYDLEQEDFYLPGFESDVQAARHELHQRQKAWARARECIKALEQQSDKKLSQRRRTQSRVDDALLDDRAITRIIEHG